jgi:hypothetical protein
MATKESSYHKPKKVPVPDMPDAGYPQTDIGKDDIMVKGRWLTGTGVKKYIEMRGAGAATRGKKFLDK